MKNQNYETPVRVKYDNKIYTAIIPARRSNVKKYLMNRPNDYIYIREEATTKTEYVKAYELLLIN